MGQLKEPLIPLTSWNDFARAAGAKDEVLGGPDLKALHQAIAELPLPNKDTLAFIIMHLQRYAVFVQTLVYLQYAIVLNQQV